MKDVVERPPSDGNVRHQGKPVDLIRTLSVLDRGAGARSNQPLGIRFPFVPQWVEAARDYEGPDTGQRWREQWRCVGMTPIARAHVVRVVPFDHVVREKVSIADGLV